MPTTDLSIRILSPNITTFTIPFNRFAPLGYRKFFAVGNRMTAIRLHSNHILLLNPIPLTTPVREALDKLGGVHFLACDLGHHMYVVEYLDAWPGAKAIGVPGLEQKRGEVKWDFVYRENGRKPEVEYGFDREIETVLFEGFITYGVAWYHKATRTLVQADLLMNLPCTEVRYNFVLQSTAGEELCILLTSTQQYTPSSAAQGLGSRLFAARAHPCSVWFRRLIYYVATVDSKLMRRDVKRVAEWDVETIVPCHGDVVEKGGSEVWKAAYRWFLQCDTQTGLVRWVVDRTGFMRLMRWVFLI